MPELAEALAPSFAAGLVTEATWSSLAVSSEPPTGDPPQADSAARHRTAATTVPVPVK
ncbi:hypothetical protein ACRJ4B_28680 [Streptomyces sp. GTA36]